MKSLNQYIIEELDNNMWWLLDKWFERNEQQYQEFITIIVQCKQNGEKVNIENLKEYIKGTQLEKNIKQFINFIDNEVNPETNKDYLYSLKQIIEMIISKKEKNKYLTYEENKEQYLSTTLLLIYCINSLLNLLKIDLTPGLNSYLYPNLNKQSR